MIFPADKDKGFKLIVSLLVCVARHAQITQNNKFAICFLDLKGNMKDEVDFCLQINAKGLKWILSFQVCEWQSLPKLPKVKSLLCLCNIIRKESIFCMHISLKVPYKLILWFWWGWLSILKVSKKTHLQQCLYNISTKII